MYWTPQHRYLLLTKRPATLARFVVHAPLPSNAWLGVSVWDQPSADRLIPELLRIPAAGYWVSYEPALAGVDFSPWLFARGQDGEPAPRNSLPGPALIVCGGESGPGARPFSADWARSVRDQCAAAGVAYWFKQDSAANYIGGQDGIAYQPDGKILLDGVAYHQLPAGLRLPGEWET